MNIKTDLFNEVEIPVIVLSTRWHKHLGTIENVDKSTISFGAKLNAADEFSFDVYKVLDNHECTLWNDIVDFKFIYVPIHDAYYEIQVSIDEDDKIIKHVTAVAACEAELDQRLLRNFECNTVDDIELNDFTKTHFYYPEEDKKKYSLLDRILKDKCQDYKIIHVDNTLRDVHQGMILSADNTGVYSFLTGDVATNVGCLFVFDSINRGISAYDLKCNCLDCGNRDEWEHECPKCGSTNCTYGYGKFTQVFISPENFAQSLSMEGDADSVKNCFLVEGGDETITAAVRSINPAGSGYIYRMSDFMLNDMPEELKDKLISYNELYNEKAPISESIAFELYEALNKVEELRHSMAPEISPPQDLGAKDECLYAKSELENSDVQVSNKKLSSVSDASVSLAVKGMATTLINFNYSLDLKDETINKTYKTDDPKEVASITWNGKFHVIKNGYDPEDTTVKPEEQYLYEWTSDKFNIPIKNDNYERFVKSKIDKMLDRKDTVFDTVFNADDEQFMDIIQKSSYEALKGYYSAYNACIEVLKQQGITEDNEQATDYFGVNLYEKMYLPYYERVQAIDAEMKVREVQIELAQSLVDYHKKQLSIIQEELDLHKYLGDELWAIFRSYIREDTYTNSNITSDGKDNAGIIELAKELLTKAQDELYKSSEMQLTLSSSLNDLLLHEEFKGFKQYVDLGNWIVTKVDGLLYRLRITDISFDYGSPENINITFSNVTRYKDYASDIEDLLSKASSMVTGFDYVANQAEKGNAVASDYNHWIENGLSSALVNIKNNDREEITFDEHGIMARVFDDTTNDYEGEQLQITHNILAFTENNWKTCTAALGKHIYSYYDEEKNNFFEDMDFGLTSKFVQAGQVYGSTIIGGVIYSDNYSNGNPSVQKDGSTIAKPKSGTKIDLRDGTFSLAAGRLRWDGKTEYIEGDIRITGDLTVLDKNNLQLFKADVKNGAVNIAGFNVVSNNNIGSIRYNTTGINDWSTPDGNPGIYIGNNGIMLTSGKDGSDVPGIRMKDGVLECWKAVIKNADIDEASIPNLSAAKITSGALTIANDTGTLFQADIDKSTVWIAGFSVGSYSKDNVIHGYMRYNTRNISDWYKAGIYIGTEGILLTNGLEEDKGGRYVQIKDGYLRCWGAQINEATIDIASIPDLSADKITSGEIDAEKIAVKNIDGKNIKAGTINASSITAGTITATQFKQYGSNTMDLGTSAYLSSTLSCSTVQINQLTIHGSYVEFTDSTGYHSITMRKWLGLD